MTFVSAQCKSINPILQYQFIEKLGEGTYGIVYKAKHKENKLLYALKKIKIGADDEGVPATTLREISLLKELNHPNIIKIEKTIYFNKDLYLVFPFINYDLKQYMTKKNNLLDFNQVRSFAFQLIESVRYCHANRILHRDLKPQNILVGSDGIIKLADFGLGREHNLPIQKLTHEVITLWYRSPEILLGISKYSGAADVWGLGCIICEMAIGKALFPGSCEIDQLFKIFQMLGTPNQQIWTNVTECKDYNTKFPQWKPKNLNTILKCNNLNINAINLIKRMLIYNPNQRITAKQSLYSPYFNDVRNIFISKLNLNKIAYYKKILNDSALTNITNKMDLN